MKMMNRRRGSVICGEERIIIKEGCVVSERIGIIVNMLK